MTIEIKSSKEQLITIKLIDDKIKIFISYPKKSRLKRRLKILEKLKEELYKS